MIMEPIKILVLDIETAPKVAMVWRFFKENISPKQVLKHGHIMSYAAKWLGEDDVIYQENRKEDDKELITSLVALLDGADIVIAHNGERFDLPQIRARALVHGIDPPSPVKVIDTYKVAKREFSFPSNSLAYLTMVLDCEIKKGGHKKFPGFELWLECLRNNEEAWEELKEYNIDDVKALEEVYLKMRPWITNHPNVTIYQEPHDEEPCCPKCDSPNINWRGYAYTQSGQYHRFQCVNCGGWGRGRYQVNKKNENLLTNVVF
jgi:DNA polymerase elongation subunit (family B)